MEVPNGTYLQTCLGQKSDFTSSFYVWTHYSLDCTANEHEEEKHNLTGNVFWKAQPCGALG